MNVTIKRAYEKPSPSDGQRILVDRLWPRGISKARAGIHHWLRELAPSTALRKWYHANNNWIGFKKRYFLELNSDEATEDLETLYNLIHKYRRVTLVYSSKNVDRNNAVALKELVEGMRKPPSSSGPEKPAAAAGRASKRRPAR
jgi:uncharacterized protein YeaO (DUF488 family)